MEIKISDEQIRAAEEQISVLCKGKVREKEFTYTMFPWIHPCKIICQYVLDHYGIYGADIEFDKEGNAHIKPTKVHPWKILADDELLDKAYPKPIIKPKDKNSPIDIDNIGSVEIIAKYPVSWML